jgi:hypothetical protein
MEDIFAFDLTDQVRRVTFESDVCRCELKNCVCNVVRCTNLRSKEHC